ncbi:MAG: response regulator [Bacilli bacterium]|nr:response regulator [Bacilli bacterium]
MDSNVLNLINTSAINVYSNITLIDIQNDKVTFFDCNNTLVETESNTYELYFEKLKKVIHPDYINKYFDAISLNKLQNSNNDYECIKYLKLSSNLSYDSYVDIIKLLPDGKIIVLSLKCDLETEKTNHDDDLSYITAELILGIENVIDHLKTDSYEVNNALKYIMELINDVKIKNSTVLKKYQEKVTGEVNKVNESLLIVDDDNLTRNIFKKVFEKDFNIIEAKNGAEAVEIIENNLVNEDGTENIVGMFLDLKMPIMDGFGVLDYLTDKRIIARLPIIIISADDAKETKEEVYSYEIADMIEKPFNYELIKKRVSNMVRMYAKSNILNDLIRIQEWELKDILKGYAKAYLIDYASINEMVSKYSKILLDKYAELKEEKVDVDSIISAARYYDLSLDFVPRKYLERINNLSEEERKVVMNYPNVGANIIKYITENESDSFVKYATNIVKLHNERYDGSGFPLGVKENQIPYYVYLINIALEYTNYIMSHSTIDYEEVKNLINNKNGTKYSPEAIEIFNAAVGEMK